MTQMASAADKLAERMRVTQAAIAEASANGSTATAREITKLVGQMGRYAATVGKTREQLMNSTAASMGITNAVKGYASSIAEATKGTHEFSLASHGAQRELLVMAHELMQGNFSRLAGSMMVLGERTGGLAQAAALLAGPLGVAAAAMGTWAVAAVKGEEEARQFAAALQMTGNYAGLTADRFAMMTAAISSTTGSGLGKASEVLRSLAASGQYTSEQIQSLATVMLDTSRVTGQSLEDVSKLYEGLSKDPAKWAQEHIGSMHNMNVATLEHIEALQRAGDKYAAFDTVVDSLLQQVQDSSQQHLSAAAKAWDSFTSAIDASWQAMKRAASGHETITDQINDLKAQRADVAASPAALQSIDASIAALAGC
jgi:phage-related minor tail protein